MSTVLNYEATINKIMKGDIPEAANNQQDYIIHISDSVGVIYANLMAKMILGALEDNASDEAIAERVNLYDNIMGVISQCRFGRLMNLVDGLNSIINEQMVRTDVFPSNRMRNNVLGFAVDWWLYNSEERSNVLVTESLDDEGNIVEDNIEESQDNEPEIVDPEEVEVAEEVENTEVKN